MTNPEQTSLLAFVREDPNQLHLPVIELPKRKTPAEAAAEFFAARISNENTRENYTRDAAQFVAWCNERELTLTSITPVHMAAYRDDLTKSGKQPTTVKRKLSALRMLFSHMVATGAIPYNPAREVKTAPIRRDEGKTPALAVEDMKQLFDSFQVETLVGLRDRALIGVMAYTFARVEAVVTLKVKDYGTQGRRSMLHLSEKGGKERELPVHHRLEDYLDAYLQTAAIGLEKNTPLFRSVAGKTGKLTSRPMTRQDAYHVVRRRLTDAGIVGDFGCHSFRATGITTFLENGGTLETAQWIAGHADSRTTKLYDRRAQRASLEDLERVRY